MKKYIEPTIEVVELESEELFMETSGGGIDGQSLTGDVVTGDDYAKKVNFADEESIW